MNNVIGVFDSTKVADEVVSDLTSSSFSSGAVTQYKGSSSDLETQLKDAGVEADDATEYANSVNQEGALVVVQAEDDKTDEAVAIMNRYYTGTDTGDAQYAAGSEQTTTNMDTADGTKFAVAEEQLQIGKREVQRGGVRVRSVVKEVPVEEQVTLRDETINVERHAVDRPVAADDANVFNEQTVELTETDEEAVVAKEARVVEEVVIGKSVENRTETVRDTVRRTDVEVEELGTRYGESLASDPQHEGREWNEVEGQAKTDWESNHQDKGTWDEAQSSIKNAWDKLRGKG